MNKQMTKQKYQKTEIQTYRIAFGGDDYLYTVSFRAAMDQTEINWLLDIARSRLYEQLPETIRQCLDLSCLEYSDFVSSAERLEHGRVMESVASLLHGSSCGCLDRLAGGADVFYGMMDHQRQIGRNCCEGCYLAVSRAVSQKNRGAEYHVIGQTFQYEISIGRENSFFTIRRMESGHPIYTLEETSGCPVLSLFGCVDVVGLLVDIHSIQTKEQAVRLANRI